MNFGRQILAARAIYPLTRVQLAKRARLAHATVKRAEEGDPTVDEEALGRIARALEAAGFEFLDGTVTISLAFHPPIGETAAQPPTAVAADASMPGMVRRIYPRTFDAASLVRDLEACGVQIENVQILLDRCATATEIWPTIFVGMAREGRKFGVRFRWRDGVINEAGLTHVIRPYPFSQPDVRALLANIMS